MDIGTPVMTPDGLGEVTKIEGKPPTHKTWFRLISGIERWYDEKNVQILTPKESGRWGEHTNDVLMDVEFIRGAQFGWNCGLDEDRERLNRAIQSRINDRVKIAEENK